MNSWKKINYDSSTIKKYINKLFDLHCIISTQFCDLRQKLHTKRTEIGSLRTHNVTCSPAAAIATKDSDKFLEMSNF